MLHEHLKLKTRSAHQAVEATLMRRIKAIRTVDDYTRLLQIFYGLYAPLERAIDAQIADHPRVDLSARRKASWILRDYTFFNGSDEIDVCEGLPEIGSFHQALGAMYVLEGSTLGGSFISRMIVQQLKVAPDGGFSFFQGYGDETNSMWKGFLRWLEMPFTEEQQQLIISSAENTFVTFKKWIDQHESD
jgi:heme oxygenase